MPVIVNEDTAPDAHAREKTAEQEAERIMRHLTQDPELGEEWLRQENLSYGALMAIAIVFVRALLPYPRDTSAMVCVLAFAVAIPLLAALIMVTGRNSSGAVGPVRAPW